MSNNDNMKNSYQFIINSLKKERDELRVKIHLASMEIRDEWEEVERKWEHLQAKRHELSEATGQSLHEAGDAFSVLGHELKETYRRLKKSI